jgi:plastocyanin
VGQARDNDASLIIIYQFEGDTTMSKKFLITLLLLSTSIVLLSTIAIAFSSCGESSRPQTGNPPTGKNVAHMGNNDFLQSSVTIHKGESITLVADTASSHIIANGSWEGSTPKASKEPGAPTVNNVNVDGNSSQAIGPFTTAGTFHLYCTIHPGMNLTVIVQ